MKQNLVVLVHNFDRSMLVVKTQSDLATLLGVSISTIKRNYNSVGIYDTTLYTVYVSPPTYDNGIEKSYNTSPSHKIANVYISGDRAKSTNNSIKRANEHQVLAHNTSDWKEIEDNLQPNEYESYYQTRTVEQLWSSYERYKFSDKPRAAIIKRIGEQKQLE